ncbi:MAG: fimbrial protein [Pseudomonadota bacterium]
MTYDDTEEQPLDPVMERVRKKMIRLMVISISIMMIGLLAVLFAIIYKFTNPGSSSDQEAARAPNDSVEINLGLSLDDEVLSSRIRDNRLVLDIRTDEGKRKVLIIDINSGQLVSRVNIH